MKRKLMPIAVATVFIIILGIGVVRCSTLLVDEQFTIDSSDPSSYSKDYRFNLTDGDRISISISSSGDNISMFGIYNSSEVYEKILVER